MGREHYYKPGSWYAYCQRCTRLMRAEALKEEWTGIMVCKECWEPRHPQELIKGIEDDQSVPWTTPKPEEVEVSGSFTDTTTEIPSGTFDNSW